MASIKEVHFFDKEANFKSTVDYSKYHSYFKSSTKKKTLGESTPIYMYWYDAPKRIWDYNPEMKFIIILRNPIERAYSHWNMERYRNVEHLSFTEAISTEERRCRKVLPHQHRVFSYIDRGFYIDQLKRIWHFFPKEQTLVIKSENLKNNLGKTLSEIAKFLDVADFKAVQHKEVYARPYITVMTNEERDYLRHIFYYTVKELEQILGWDCSDWLQ
jgi:hypothetical protein